MRERPILMKGPLVCASLEDRKTQTRRICKAACERGIWADSAHPARDGMPIFWWNIVGGAMNGRADFTRQAYATGTPCPYGKAGDQLWVRETWCECDSDTGRAVAFRADSWQECPADDGKWRPSIHMPRWASRLTLAITGVRVERLQDISEADKEAEGLTEDQGYGPAAFASLWDSTTTTTPAHRWAASPWVWVITYRRIP